VIIIAATASKKYLQQEERRQLTQVESYELETPAKKLDDDPIDLAKEEVVVPRSSSDLIYN
jgi:hypothetical protein